MRWTAWRVASLIVTWRADAVTSSAHNAAAAAVSAGTLRRAKGPRRLLLIEELFFRRWIPPCAWLDAVMRD
jgi:hypothetical protein